MSPQTAIVKQAIEQIDYNKTTNLIYQQIPELKNYITPKDMSMHLKLLNNRRNLLDKNTDKYDKDVISPVKTNTQLAQEFIKAYKSVETMLKDELYNIKVEHLSEKEKIKLKLSMADTIFLYGNEYGGAAVIQTFGEMTGSENLYNIILILKKQTLENVRNVKFISEVIEDITQKVEKQSIDPIRATLLINIKDYTATIKPVKVQEEPVMPEEELVSDNEITQQIIDNINAEEIYIDPAQLAGMGYLDHTNEIIMLYQKTGILISPQSIAAVEKVFDENKIKPRRKGILGIKGRYSFEEAVGNTVKYIQSCWNTDDLKNVATNQDELEAMQKLVLILGIYEYMQGKGAVKRLIDSDELSIGCKNNRLDTGWATAFINKVYDNLSEQGQIIQEALKIIFQNHNKQVQNIKQMYAQMEMNRKAMQYITSPETIENIEYLAKGSEPFTENDKQKFIDNAMRFAQQKIKWDEFLKNFKVPFTTTEEWIQQGFIPTYYGDRPISQGGHGEYTTMGGQTMLDRKGRWPSLNSTSIIQKNWKKACAAIKKNGEVITVTNVAQEIINHPRKYGLLKNDKQILEDAIKFYKAVEQNQIELINEYSPANDLYYSAANYCEKWQDLFEHGFFTYAEQLGWVKILDDKGNKIARENLATTQWGNVEITKKRELYKVMKNQDYMVQLSYAFAVLGPESAAILHSKYGIDWVEKTGTPRGRKKLAKELKDILKDAERRLNDYNIGRSNIEKFVAEMNDINNTIKLTEKDQMKKWSELTDKLREEKLDELTDYFVDYLEQNRNSYMKRSISYPLYFRFYELTEHGLGEVNRDKVRDEIKAILDTKITDGFNPFITLGFLATSNTYENDYTRKFHNIKSSDYTIHFDPFGTRIEQTIGTTGPGFNRALGFDGIMKTMQTDTVKVKKGYSKTPIILTDGNISFAMQHPEVTEITVFGKKTENVVAKIDTQTLLSITEQGAKGRIRYNTTNIKNAEVTLYLARVQTDGTLEYIESPFQSELVTDENGQTSITFNLNQKQNKKFVFEEGKTYVIMGRAHDRTIVSQNEHIATFKINRTGKRISPVPDEDAMAMYEKRGIRQETNIDGYVTTNPTAILQYLDGDTFKDIFEKYFGINGTVIDDERLGYSYKNGDHNYDIILKLQDDKYIIESINGIINDSANYVTDALAPFFSEVYDTLLNDKSDWYQRFFLKNISLGVFEGNLTYLGENLLANGVENGFFNDIDTFKEQINDLWNPAYGMWYIDRNNNIVGNMPPFLKTIHNIYNIATTHFVGDVKLKSTPTKITSYEISSKLFNEIQEHGWNISFGIMINPTEEKMYIVSMDEELEFVVNPEKPIIRYYYQGYVKTDIELSKTVGMTIKPYVTIGSEKGLREISSSDEVVTDLINVLTQTQEIKADTPSYAGLQGIVGILLSKNGVKIGGADVNAKVTVGVEGGTLDYFPISNLAKGKKYVGGSFGAEIYINDIIIKGSLTQHDALDKLKTRDLETIKKSGKTPELRTFMFSLNIPINKKVLKDISLDFVNKTYRYSDWRSYGVMKGGVSAGLGFIGNSQITVNAGGTYTKQFYDNTGRLGWYGGLAIDGVVDMFKSNKKKNKK